MKKELLDILACPECKGELGLNALIDPESLDEIKAGTLVCRKCHEVYPIEDGIPNMLPRKLRRNE